MNKENFIKRSNRNIFLIAMDVNVKYPRSDFEECLQVAKKLYLEKVMEISYPASVNN